jgi:hypothetical protein
MATKTINIDDATNAQLLAYAQMMGLDARQGHQNAFLVNMIRQADPSVTEIEVDDVTSNPTQPTPAPRAEVPERNDQMVGSSFRSDPKVRIIVPSQEKPGGRDPVQVGVNGVTFLIKRDEEMDVPFRVFEVLKNSEQTEYSQVDGPTATSPKEMRAFTTKGYPFSILEMPPADQIAKFREATASSFAP